MAIAMKLAEPSVLTYEDYLTEGEVDARYDIIDGERIYMTNPSIEHQTIQFNVAMILRDFQRKTRSGRMVTAPCDIVIRRAPLRTRQPDVLFITNERFGDRQLSDPSPLDYAPELVVEVLSPSDKRNVLNAKIRDYAASGVKECWIISPQDESIEIVMLTPGDIRTADIYFIGQSFISPTFHDLTVAVTQVFSVEY